MIKKIISGGQPGVEKAALDAALKKAGLDGILGEETIPLDEKALGRVLSAPIWAKMSSPHYHASAMDGFAVLDGQTIGALETAPLVFKMGSLAQYVDTGDLVSATGA